MRPDAARADGPVGAGGALQGIATIPEGLWELLLGIYCTVKGFKPSSPILRAGTHDDPQATMLRRTPPA